MTETAPRPVRLAHFGLGNFHRSHQAWYTQADPEWGIAAFTGRSPRAAETLTRQENRYGLITRGPAGDEVELIDSIVTAHDGADPDALQATFTEPELAAVTLTITEAGYEPGTDTALTRLTAGLAARHRAGLSGIAVVPCDNLSDNAAVTRRAVLALAERSDDALATWIDQGCGFVRTSVDRITPASVDADREVVRRATGFDDRMPVVTEPFTSWHLAGSFPAGRPPWELRGARFVDDVAPFERRKLLLLNGGHTLLATLGTVRGLATIAEAMADPVCTEWLHRFWSDASGVVGGDQQEYLQALESRFTNPRISHRLAQIGDGVQLKLDQRIRPVLQATGSEAAALVIATQAYLDGDRRTVPTPLRKGITS